MIKLAFKLLILVAILACIAPFLLKGPDGQPFLSTKDLKWPELSKPKLPDVQKIVDKAKDILPEKGSFDTLGNLISGKKKVKIYKWKNKEGAWVFSDQPNPNGTYETMHINPAKDLIHLDVPQDPLEGEITQKDTSYDITKIKEKISSLPFPSTVPINEVPKMIKDAKKTKKELENKYKGLGHEINK